MKNENHCNDIYGYELIIDLHECDVRMFTRNSIDKFFSDLCRIIDMQKCEVHFWDDLDVPEEERQTAPHTKGTSAVCFILTSTITIHTLDILKAVYVNIFSCKEFDPLTAERFTKEWFDAGSCRSTFVTRV